MKFTYLLPVLTLAFLLTSCTKESESSDIDSNESAIEVDYENGLDIIEYPDNLASASTEDLETRNTYNSYFTYNTLNAALKFTGLDRAVFSGNKTVYAPSDAAFQTIGHNQYSIVNLRKDELRTILLYHVIDGSVDDSDKGCIEMIDGNIAHLKGSDHEPEINDALVYTAFTARGPGYRVRLNAINKVLAPPTQNIVGTAAGTEMFSSLVSAVLAADPAVAAALSDPAANFTVFAPTNQAFMNLIEALGVGDLNGLVAAIGVDNLTQVLLYHVVDGCAFSNELKNGQSITTLLGENIKTDFKRYRSPRIEDAKGGKSKLVLSALDIITANGVVHTIDSVLLPSII